MNRLMFSTKDNAYSYIYDVVYKNTYKNLDNLKILYDSYSYEISDVYVQYAGIYELWDDAVEMSHLIYDSAYQYADESLQRYLVDKYEDLYDYPSDTYSFRKDLREMYKVSHLVRIFDTKVQEYVGTHLFSQLYKLFDNKEFHDIVTVIATTYINLYWVPEEEHIPGFSGMLYMD